MTKHQMFAISRALKFEYVNARSVEARCAIRSCMIEIGNAINETSPNFNRTLFLCDAGHPEYETGRFVRLIDEDMKKHDKSYFGVEI